MQRLPVTPDLFHGHVSIHEGADGAAPVRLPLEELALYPSPDDMLVERHVMDLTVDGALVSSVVIPPNADTVEFTIPDDSTPRDASAADLPVCEVWLHQFHSVRIRSLQADDGSSLRPAPDDRPRWLTYGSSITMCRGAGSPARTWPAVAARVRGLNLQSLGYGGHCHLDPMVGRLIRDTPTDLITLKLGINVYGGASLSARTYPAAVIGLVRLIRERHPEIPIGVVTSIASPDRERTPNAVGCTLEDYREMTRDAVARLVAAGDERLVIFEGTDLLAGHEAHLMLDGVHPGPEGYELIGRRVAEQVLPPLLEMRG